MVEEAVGNVTTWLRRWVMGALEHQHAPLPQEDEDEPGPYRFNGGSATANGTGTNWWPWQSTPPPGYGRHAPTLQDDDEERERERRRDRERGRQEERRVETDEEREHRELQMAMEISRREAEEAEKVRKEVEEAAAAADAAAAARPLPDLMSMEADLLGLENGASSGAPAAPFSATAGAGHIIPYDPTANDEAIARTLNLLDMDSGPSDADLLSKIEASKPKPNANPADADLLALLDGPPSALNSQSGALVALHPNKLPSRTTAGASQGTCGGCSKKIEQGRFLTCLSKTWHPQCFKCASCSRVISDREFKAQDGSAYHEECFRVAFHPKCAVCNDYIKPGEGGLIQFRSLPFWGDKTCLSHTSDGTPHCTACHRFEPKGTPFVELQDGRKLCLECVESIVVDSADCLPIFLEVQEFFRGLGMPILQEIPLHCVELQALNDAAAHEKGHQGHSVTRGLCLSEEHVVQTVVRLPGNPRGLPFGGVGQRVESLSRHCQVTAILILYGLPRLLTGEILAHELMHAWFRLDGNFPVLSPDIEEGLCQVLAHLWLQAQLGALAMSQHPPGSPGAFQTKFAEFCMHQVAMDTSPVYGEGFRKAYTATVQHGLLHTLDVVRKTGQLPN